MGETHETETDRAPETEPREPTTPEDDEQRRDEAIVAFVGRFVAHLRSLGLSVDSKTHARFLLAFRRAAAEGREG